VAATDTWLALQVLLAKVSPPGARPGARVPETAMTLPDRDHLLRLLDELGSADDATVLTAARTLDAQMRSAGIGWSDLMVTSLPLEDDAQDDLDDLEVKSLEEHADFEPDPGNEDPAAMVGLIEGLLARSDLSEETRAELASFSEEIKAGSLEAADQRYLLALHRRLAR